MLEQTASQLSCQRQAGAQSTAVQPLPSPLNPFAINSISTRHRNISSIIIPINTLIMSFDCGFDIFPALLPTPENKTRYAEFLDDITTVYETDKESRLLVLPTDTDFPSFLDKRFIHFVLTQNPRIPANPNNCDLFLSLRSTSVFDAGTIDTIKEIATIARHHFGSSVHFWTDQSVIYTRGEVDRAEWEVSTRENASDSQ
ncbi:hypothetical protein FGADI_8931 [Fusarium gaditjirri]|uniref:Uncharacterized protein n=1 Tax=Fusarium gaditjirri TaxID=282569 RepID=A0A8H4T1B0_9HYPO|nr:hypothetical protein FGADI_8931 [Fusarium gaditjirri]